MIKYLLAISSIALLPACSTLPVYDYEPVEEQRLLTSVLSPGESAPTTAGVDVLTLNDEIRSQLDERIQNSWSDTRKLEALRHYLFSSDRLGIEYDPQETRTAIETYEARSGNCLSLTNLFIAAARYVGLDANYRTIEVRPTWDKSSGTVIRYEHIVATGNLNRGETYVVDFLPEFVIGDSDSQQVSDEAGLSLYYNNMGAESLIGGDAEQAVSWLRHALALRPDFSAGWTNMGTAMNRLGRPELAEFSYRKALLADSKNYSALSNLAAFYRAAGEEKKAELFLEQVNRYRRRNPYFHYFVAEILYEEGQYEDAKLLLKRSIELKRNEPEFYAALAKLHEALGEDRQSQEMKARAQRFRQMAFDVPDREMNHRYWTY